MYLFISPKKWILSRRWPVWQGNNRQIFFFQVNKVIASRTVQKGILLLSFLCFVCLSSYCSEKGQRSHWRLHKFLCSPPLDDDKQPPFNRDPITKLVSSEGRALLSFRCSVSDLIYKRVLWDGKKKTNSSIAHQEAIHNILQYHVDECTQTRGFPFPPRFK
jgi:hypothetical protein